MPISSHKFGDTITVNTKYVDGNNNGITNATVITFQRRDSDGKYWNGSTFQVARISLTAIEEDEINAAGFWKQIFDTVNGLTDDIYFFEFEDTSGNADNVVEILRVVVQPDIIENKIDIIDTNLDQALIDISVIDAKIVVVDGKVTILDTKVTRILGLSHENFVLEPTTLDPISKEITAGKVRIYTNPTDTLADDGATGLVDEYSIIATYTAGLLNKFIQVKQ